MFGMCREALPDVRECSGGPPVYPVVVGRPSRMSGSGLGALLNVRKTRPDVRSVLKSFPYVR